MLKMDSKTIRFLARMGSRGAFGQAIYDFALDGNDFFAVSADLAHASGFDRIIKNYPEKFVETGIAEQNMIGISAGLANTGLPVAATTWAMFASVRVADQVRNFMGYMQANIKLVGMDSGLEQSRFSYSHANPPDIAVMRAIPGITILSPCDGIEIYKAVYAAMRLKGPVYIRLTGGNLLPILHKAGDFNFEIGKSIILREGNDVAITACGTILKNVMEAAELLEKRGVSVKVVDMHTIYPLDKEALMSLCSFPLVVTVEEHLIHGGLGSAVSEFYAMQEYRPKQLMIGIENHYPQPGSVSYTWKENGLMPEQIMERIVQDLEQQGGSRV